jgi:oxygen-independent coproporphyrinogen-3 oxidase
MHLYLHIPFCARRCTYCDFAIAVRRDIPAASYATAVLKEWQSWQGHSVWHLSPIIETFYLGGGTPSLLDPEAMERILAGIQSARPFAADAEITIEANPDDVSPSRAARWRAIGVNRISLGAQSFHPSVLAWMHRIHTVEDIARAVSVLRDAGFRNLSLDLIFALPPELERDWTRDLDSALALRPEHLSLYGLTVEPHTPLARWVERGTTARTDDERYADEFLQSDRALQAEGFEHYEVSNAAQSGFRARHNSAYWQRRPYIGLGPSAHSGIGRERQWNIREWSAYHHAVEAGSGTMAGAETLSDEAVGLENLYLGLRTVEGIPAALLSREGIVQWVEQGWAIAEGNRVRLTPEGWLRLDALVAHAAGTLAVRSTT